MLKLDYIQFIVIDLFCGAGGTTLGFEQAEHSYDDMYRFLKSCGIDAPKEEKDFFRISKVVACVNHDHLAITSHWQNHPDVEHFEEDIRILDPYGRLRRLVEIYRAFYPDAKIILWASLECTNFSKAKGGLPRDADSRTLAEHLYKYIDALDPDYIKIENVVEFMSWGPLDKNGKPISKKSGIDWLNWRAEINRRGYYDDWKELNSADFGAYTSRNRLFGCFAKVGLPMAWPGQTHHKKPESVSVTVKKWMPVKHVLDFDDEGNSIFNRKKHLSTKTMQRLFMGCVKHIAGGKENFITKYYSGQPESKNITTDGPAGTIKCKDNQAFVFITKWNSNNPITGGHPGHSINEPAPVVSTQNRLGLVEARFITKAFSSHNNKSVNAGSSIEEPSPTISVQNRLGLAHINFISRYNGVNGGKHDNSQSVEGPVGALGTGDNHAKVSAHFIQKYYTQGGQHNSIEEPASTLSTRDRLSKVTANFINQRNGNGSDRSKSIDEPAKTITATGGNQQLIQADFFIDKQFSGDDNHQSVEQPAGSILTNDKHNLVKAEKFILNGNYHNGASSLEDPSPVLTGSRRHHYIINPSWGGHSGSVEEPCHVVIARQDKAPLYVITCKEGPVAVPVYEDDCEWTVKLKEFMALYNICDIKMRMLKVPELKKIQGFPADYILLGNQTDQKKFIGNAVHPLVPMFWIKAFSKRLAA